MSVSMTDFVPALKDRLIFFGWIAALLIAASLLWSLTFPFRAACLLQPVNRALTLIEDDRRLSSPLARAPAGPVPFGCWYSLADSGSLFFVFAIMRDGMLIPCGAEITEDGEVEEIVPLGSHARQVMGRIPQGLIQVYIQRIESAAARMGER